MTDRNEQRFSETALVGLSLAADSFALCGDVSGKLSVAIEKVGRLRELGEDPTHTPAANQKTVESVSEKWALRKEWVNENAGRVKAERERFRKEICPQFADVPARSIARACGCSLGYASKFQSGEYVPHSMHNAALDRLLDEL